MDINHLLATILIAFVVTFVISFTCNYFFIAIDNCITTSIIVGLFCMAYKNSTDEYNITLGIIMMGSCFILCKIINYIVGYFN